VHISNSKTRQKEALKKWVRHYVKLRRLFYEFERGFGAKIFGVIATFLAINTMKVFKTANTPSFLQISFYTLSILFSVSYFSIGVILLLYLGGRMKSTVIFFHFVQI